MTGGYSSSELGFDSLTARSVALSALLGEHPPLLPGRALVALGQVLGIAEGAMRTALSRLVGAGEVVARDGGYALGERLRDRQRAQDSGRPPVPDGWDGSWWFAIVEAQRRPLPERRAFRARMRLHRMGELRPDLWLRPANIEGPAAEGGVLVVRGSLTGRDPVALVDRFWDRPRLARQARALRGMVEDTRGRMAAAGPGALRDAALLTVAVNRFLLREPRLPPALLGPDWPLDALRAGYDRFEPAYRELLAAFLAAQGDAVTGIDRDDQSR